MMIGKLKDQISYVFLLYCSDTAEKISEKGEALPEIIVETTLHAHN